MAAPARPGPGVADPRAVGPGVAAPAAGRPGVAGPGVRRPGVAAPVAAGPGHRAPARPGPARPGPAGAGPDRAVPAAAVPGRVRPGGGRPGRGLPRPAEDVPLAGQGRVAVIDVDRAAGLLQEPGAGGHPGRRRHRRRLLDRVGHVRDPVAAVQLAHLLRQLRGAGQGGLHLVRGGRGVGLQVERGQAGDDRRRLRGAGAAEEPAADPGRGDGLVQRAAGHPQPEDVHCGRDQVDAAAARAALAPDRDLVLVHALLAHRVVRADRDHQRVDRRGSQLGPAGALVAAGDDHDDARLPGVLDRVGQRVEARRLGRVGAVGEVQHPDREAGVVGVLHHPVDRGDHLGHVAAAVAGGHLERDQPGVRRDPGEPSGGRRGVLRAGRHHVAAGDDRGQVGAVAEAVQVPQVRLRRLQRQVRAVDHVAAGQPGDRGDPAVDQGDVDPLARPALLPGAVGRGEAGDLERRAVVTGQVVAQGGVDGLQRAPAVWADGAHPVLPGQLARRPGRDPGGDTIDDAEVAGDGAAQAFHRSQDRGPAAGLPGYHYPLRGPPGGAHRRRCRTGPGQQNRCRT